MAGCQYLQLQNWNLSVVQESEGMVEIGTKAASLLRCAVLYRVSKLPTVPALSRCREAGFHCKFDAANDYRGWKVTSIKVNFCNPDGALMTISRGKSVTQDV